MTNVIRGNTRLYVRVCYKHRARCFRHRENKFSGPERKSRRRVISFRDFSSCTTPYRVYFCHDLNAWVRTLLHKYNASRSAAIVTAVNSARARARYHSPSPSTGLERAPRPRLGLAIPRSLIFTRRACVRRRTFDITRDTVCICNMLRRPDRGKSRSRVNYYRLLCTRGGN